VIVYLDSSVVLAKVLKEPGAMASWGEWEMAISSSLTQVELVRTFARYRALGKMSDEEFAFAQTSTRRHMQATRQVPLRVRVLRRAAGPFPAIVRTLDAIHLSTALLWQEDTGEDLTFLTHDRQLRIAAQACGLATSKS